MKNTGSGDQDTVVDGTQYTFTVTNRMLTTKFKGFNGYRKEEIEPVTHIKTTLDLKGNFSALTVSTSEKAPEKRPDGYVKDFGQYIFYSDTLYNQKATLRINPETNNIDHNQPIWSVGQLKYGNCKITKKISNKDVNKYLLTSQE